MKLYRRILLRVLIAAPLALALGGCDYYWSVVLDNHSPDRIELVTSFEPPPVYLRHSEDSLYKGRLTHFWLMAPQTSIVIGGGLWGSTHMPRTHLRLEYDYLEIRKPGDTTIYHTPAEIISHCDSIDGLHYRLVVSR
jgi:hypothetical protein